MSNYWNICKAFVEGKKIEKKWRSRVSGGMQDGKVFDFVSRTTPTAGSEPSFIKNAVQGLLRF